MRDTRSPPYRPALLSFAAVAVWLSACSGPGDKAAPGAAVAPVATTVAAPVASAPASAVAAAPELAQQVLGAWNQRMTLPLPDAPEVKNQVVTLNGRSEYFPNRSMSFKGTGQLKATGQDAKGKPVPFEVDFELQSSDEWSVTDRTVYEKSVDLRLKVAAIRLNGKELQDDALRDNLEKEMAKSFLRGDTSALKTVAIDATHWRYEQELEPGRTVTVDALRP